MGLISFVKDQASKVTNTFDRVTTADYWSDVGHDLAQLPTQLVDYGVVRPLDRLGDVLPNAGNDLAATAVPLGQIPPSLLNPTLQLTLPALGSGLGAGLEGLLAGAGGGLQSGLGGLGGGLNKLILPFIVVAGVGIGALILLPNVLKELN